MKTTLRYIAAALVGVALGFAPAASALTTTTGCNISNGTGGESVNTCSVSDTTKVTITCKNSVDLSNINSQTATSGEVTANENTIVGNASSGDADNIASFANELALGCAKAATKVTPSTTTTTKPTATPTPTPGRGAGAVQGAGTPQKVAALPNTGPADIATTIGVSALAAGVLAAGVQLAGSMYRRRAFKA